MNFSNCISNSICRLSSATFYFKYLESKSNLMPAELKAHNIGAMVFILIELTRPLTESYVERLIGKKQAFVFYTLCPYAIMGTVWFLYNTTFQINVLSLVLFNYLLPMFVEPYVYSKFQQVALSIENQTSALYKLAMKNIQNQPEEKQWSDYFETSDFRIILKNPPQDKESLIAWLADAKEKALSVEDSHQKEESIVAIVFAQFDLDFKEGIETFKELSECRQIAVLPFLLKKVNSLQEAKEFLSIARAFSSEKDQFRCFLDVAMVMYNFSVGQTIKITEEILSYRNLELTPALSHKLVQFAKQLTDHTEIGFQLLRFIAEKNPMSLFDSAISGTVNELLGELPKKDTYLFLIQLLDKSDFFEYVNRNGWNKPNGTIIFGYLYNLDPLLRLDPSKTIDLVSKFQKEKVRFEFICYAFRQLIKLSKEQEDRDALLNIQSGIQNLITKTIEVLGVSLSTDAFKVFEQVLAEYLPPLPLQTFVHDEMHKAKKKQFKSNPLKVGLYNILFVAK